MVTQAEGQNLTAMLDDAGAQVSDKSCWQGVGASLRQMAHSATKPPAAIH